MGAFGAKDQAFAGRDAMTHPAIEAARRELWPEEIWGGMSPAAKASHLREIQRAIVAFLAEVREPSEAMQAAGHQAICSEHGNIVGVREYVKIGYRGAIDALRREIEAGR